ncbi:MAG TPA: hypothetical protein VKT81_08895 [Bryobacteraceae bacterium]|nr:hypothetical protein [Bryobacteraceae bacterium]
MKPLLSLFTAAFALTAISAFAQTPTIANLGVRNSAGYTLPGLPNSGIAQGSLFLVFGQNLGPAKIVQVSSFPLPTSQGLSGTSIQVTINGTKVDAIMLYTLATQVAAVLPSTTPIGTGTLTVTYNGQTSAPAPITVVKSSFGIFAVNQSGTGQGVLQNVLSQSDRPFNSATASAQPGEVIILWGTGLGPVNGDETAGPLPGDLSSLNVHVWVGGKDAVIQYRGRSGCCTGDDQIVFVVPAGVEGCAVPVFVQIDNTISNFVTMAIGNNGAQCTDPGALTPAQIATAEKNGGIRSGTLNIAHYDGLTPKHRQVSDGVGAVFAKTPLSALAGYGAVVPKGSCSEIQFPIALAGLNSYLDAGKVSFNGPPGSYDLVEASKGSYSLSFLPSPTSIPGIITDGTTLSAGTYNFTGTGGADVGAFTASLNFVKTFFWDQSVSSIDRSQPLTIKWTGGTSGSTVTMSVVSSLAPGPNGSIGSVIFCYADGSAGTFTIPAALLSALPPSFTDANGNPQGTIEVFETIYGPSFTASGLDVTTTFSEMAYTRSFVKIQ